MGTQNLENLVFHGRLDGVNLSGLSRILHPAVRPPVATGTVSPTINLSFAEPE